MIAMSKGKHKDQEKNSKKRPHEKRKQLEQTVVILSMYIYAQSDI